MEDFNIVKQFHIFLQRPEMQHFSGKWLIAVSGGVDSVVLCHLCSRYGIPYAIAHCNFNLRGEESLKDKAFVTWFAKEKNIELFTQDFDTTGYMAEEGISSVQVAARALRYQWFFQLMEKHGFAFLATAHHTDDNIETVLMNLFRGTGIRGLRGILPIQNKVIRPLLGVTKNAILDYARIEKLSWVEDSSNSSDKYTRNYIRHQILPVMKAAIPQSEKGFEKSLEMMAETEMLYHEVVDLYKKRLIEKKGNEIHIPILKLFKIKPLKTVLYEIIKDFNFHASQVDTVIHLLNSETGKYITSSSHRIIRNRQWLIIASLQTEQSQYIVIEKDIKYILYTYGRLYIWTSDKADALPFTKDKAFIDAAQLIFPIIMRPWKAGDYFYPLGMRKKKKLSRFFIDQKLSQTDKEKIWVIESDKKIVWIIGYRLDDRYKVTPFTKNVIALEIIPH